MIYLFVKRLLDFFISAGSIFLLSPLLFPLMFILRLTGEGYIFYSQKRVGYKNKPFDLLKFATMLKDSPNLPGGTITSKKDPRVLPLGGFLRKTKINELPQLFNILKGDMSFVGPRPQTEECFKMFPESLHEKIYLSKPGLTGVGSIVFRDEEEITAKSSKKYDECYREDIMPYKGDLEIWYYENRSIWLDCKLIVLTFLVVLYPTLDPYSFIKNLPCKPDYL